MGFKGNISSLMLSNKKKKKRQKICLGWDENPPTAHVVSCKRLREESLLTFKDMVGCCVENNGEEHFEFECRNVYADDMNEGKMEYTKFGKVGLNNNHLSFSHSNILQRAHQGGVFCKNKYLGVTLAMTLCHMCKVAISTLIQRGLFH